MERRAEPGHGAHYDYGLHWPLIALTVGGACGARSSTARSRWRRAGHPARFAEYARPEYHNHAGGWEIFVAVPLQLSGQHGRMHTCRHFW